VLRHSRALHMGNVLALLTFRNDGPSGRMPRNEGVSCPYCADDLLTGKTMSIEEATVYNMWEIVAIGECTDSLNLRILCRQRRMTEILKVRHASTTN
jgi:hypothetical protein